MACKENCDCTPTDFEPKIPIDGTDIMNQDMLKSFNIKGSCVPTRHSALPVLSRLLKVNKLIKEQEYFDLHVPRLSGKQHIY